jgi:hypothetical protein
MRDNILSQLSKFKPHLRHHLVGEILNNAITLIYHYCPKRSISNEAGREEKYLAHTIENIYVIVICFNVKVLGQDSQIPGRYWNIPL